MEQSGDALRIDTVGTIYGGRGDSALRGPADGILARVKDKDLP
jgi:hypothetical protein